MTDHGTQVRTGEGPLRGSSPDTYAPVCKAAGCAGRCIAQGTQLGAV